MSRISNALNLKCPKCQTGTQFETGSFSFDKPFDMRDRCDHCNQNFMPEPGFYYGAMFISYIFMGWFCLGFVAIFHWVLGWSTAASFGLLLLVCAIIFVYIFRASRSVWLHFNVKYDPKTAEKSVS